MSLTIVVAIMATTLLLIPLYTLYEAKDFRQSSTLATRATPFAKSLAANIISTKKAFLEFHNSVCFRRYAAALFLAQSDNIYQKKFYLNILSSAFDYQFFLARRRLVVVLSIKRWLGLVRMYRHWFEAA